VITGNVVPDHATIARFIVRHERALAGLFDEVLRLCDQAGLVKPGLIAIDGTRLAGNANSDATRQFEQIALEILAEVRATDEGEDKEHGEERGDELPEPSLSTSGETLTIEESMTLRARTENAGHAGDEHERSWSWSSG
jgi:hypothetical protein